MYMKACATCETTTRNLFHKRLYLIIEECMWSFPNCAPICEVIEDESEDFLS